MEYKILAGLFNDSNIKLLCKLVKYPDSLYDYIKSGRSFNDYVNDFENGSILNGTVVSKDSNDYLVSSTNHNQWVIINLDTFIIVDYFADESLILADYCITSNNLIDYYADKLLPTSIDNIKDRYNEAIFRLSDEVKELNSQLEYADDQLESNVNIIYKLEDYIHELTEKIISLIMEG